ncbi:MAG TPA: lysophospholipid acyltransferase family protein [Ideonella sp.]|nr:lysophospholipid acyltransferase family protein [Ideonella sp.]
MRALRAPWRLARCLGHTLHGMAICAFAFPRLDTPARMRHVQRWSARMLAALGVECAVDGAAHAGPVLLVANHVSWLDILAINAVQPARFVAKAEVHRWPLLGWLVASAGTLFIERERKRDALRVVHQVAAALAAGEVVAVFPEGTTSAGDAVLPFHANLLQAALSAGAPLQPIALRYSDARGTVSRAAAYVGETSLAASLWQVLWARELRVRVALLAVEPSLLDRRAMAERVRTRIAQALP